MSTPNPYLFFMSFSAILDTSSHTKADEYIENTNMAHNDRNTCGDLLKS
jgi:hypothetical protein